MTSQTRAAPSQAPTLHRSSAIAMDTVVTVEVVSPSAEETVRAAIHRALDWFAVVEQACSRFDGTSEVRRLLGAVGRPVPASPTLFEAVRFALVLAEMTEGAFDPTVGHLLEARGFNRHYATGERVRSPAGTGDGASYRDVLLDPANRTITLRRPLVLDLGAVAKGLAIDLAARDLSGFGDFCVEAGGDLFAHGRNAQGQRWRVGVEHPRDPGAVAHRLEISDQAVCTSGDYERRTADGADHHLVDPRTSASARALASVTVIAPTALVADGLSTAAFILGLEEGLRLLERAGVGGVFITPSGGTRIANQPKKAKR